MGTVDSGTRHWPMHGRPPSPSPAARDPHGPWPQEPPRDGRMSDKSSSPPTKDSLPSIAFLDLHRTARDPPLSNREQNPPAMAPETTGSISTQLASPTASSFPHQHPPPPPPHQTSDSHTSYKPSGPNSACPSPRRPGQEEREQQQQQQPPASAQPRQSLPSIHEALGGSNPTLPYPAASQQHPPTTPATTAAQQHFVPRPTGDAPSGPPNPFSNPPPPASAPSATTPTYARDYPSSHPTQSGQQQQQQQQQDGQQPQRLSLISITSQDSAGRSAPSLGSSNRSPTQSSKTGQSSISSSGRSSEPPGPTYTKAMSSPTSYGPYGQSPLAYQSQHHHHHHHHQHHQQQHPPPPPPPPPPHQQQHVPSGHAPVPYSSAPAPAPVHFDARPPGGPAPWGSGPVDYAQAEDPQHSATTPRGNAPMVPYSESVKRHLEGYDVEASLNEIAEASSRSLDFSRVYATRAHQNNRAGPLVGSLPSLSEIDALQQLNRRSSDALAQIRHTVVSQEHAMAEQQTAQQRHGLSEGPYQGDRGATYQEETKDSGGFASGDAKKRRGKAAPPGRCHSCNRAETPEWRRGPDGARTLCNACGLHYAKLTRKMGAHKASAMGSNFRPRSSVEMRS